MPLIPACGRQGDLYVLKPTWATELVPGQPGLLHRETLSQYIYTYIYPFEKKLSTTFPAKWVLFKRMEIERNWGIQRKKALEGRVTLADPSEVKHCLEWEPPVAPSVFSSHILMRERNG